METDAGVQLELAVAWTLPDSLARHGQGRLSIGWTFDPASRTSGPWTPCAEDGAPHSCAEAWGVGPLTSRWGLTRVRVPLAPLAGVPPREALEVVVAAPGRRVLTARLTPPVPDLVRRTVAVQPGKLDVTCPLGQEVHWEVVSGGFELARSGPRPCGEGPVRWPGKEFVHAPAFEGDRLQLRLVAGTKVITARRIVVHPGKTRVDLTEETSGIRRSRPVITIE